MARDLYDAVYGALAAGAVGDALGAPAENLYYQEIEERFGRITDFLAYDNVRYSSGKPGAITDDTTLKHYMCLAIVRKGGRINPDDAARVWLDRLNTERFWSPDKITYLKLKAGVSAWDAGRGNIPSACATMAMAPIGIINAGNPEQAYQDGYNIAALNADGFNREAPAMYAAGMAAAFAPGASVKSIVDCMRTYSSPTVRRAVELTMDLAASSRDPDEFKRKFYDRLLDWWSRPKLDWRKDHFADGTSIESVPVAMALFSLCRGDVNQCLLEGANFGRDADAISSLAGALAGAIEGASAIRPGWVAAVEEANGPFFEEVEGDRRANFASMASRLVEALGRERAAAQARVEMLGRILERR